MDLLLLVLLEGRLLDGALDVGLLLELDLGLGGWLLHWVLWGRPLCLHLARCLRHL